MVSVRLRLRTLLLAIAVIGIGLGGHRWWVGWREIQKMAKEHFKVADTLLSRIDTYEVMRQSTSKLYNEYESISDDQKLQSLRQEAARRAQRAGFESEDEVTLRGSVRLHALARDDFRHETELWTRRIALVKGQEQWHRARGVELRRMLVFNLQRERERDRLQAEREARDADRVRKDSLTYTIAMKEQELPIHEELAQHYEALWNKVPLDRRQAADALPEDARSKHPATLLQQRMELQRDLAQGARRVLETGRRMLRERRTQP